MRFTAILSASLAASLAGCGSREDRPPPPVTENAAPTVEAANAVDEPSEADTEDPAAADNSEATESGTSVEGTSVEPALDPAKGSDDSTPASSGDPDESLAAAEDAVDNARQAVDQASDAADGQ